MGWQAWLDGAALEGTVEAVRPAAPAQPVGQRPRRELRGRQACGRGGLAPRVRILGSGHPVQHASRALSAKRVSVGRPMAFPYGLASGAPVQPITHVDCLTSRGPKFGGFSLESNGKLDRSRLEAPRRDDRPDWIEVKNRKVEWGKVALSGGTVDVSRMWKGCYPGGRGSRTISALRRRV